MKQETHQFLLTSLFSLTPTMTTGPQKQDEFPSSFRKAERLDYASFEIEWICIVNN